MKTKPTPAMGDSASHPFIARHQAEVIGVLQGWDRLRLQGTLRSLYHASVMEYYLKQAGVLWKNFKAYTLQVTERIKQSVEALAKRSEREIQYVKSSALRKEDLAREAAQKGKIEQGLITILSAVEPCRSWSIRRDPQTQRPGFQIEWRKCLHYYFYWQHKEWGFCHLRLQTWFPFLVQICLNGREWLSRRLDREGLRYRREANCLPWVEDVARAQAIFQEQAKTDWPKLCAELLDGCHPLHREISAPLGAGYYWSVAESEYATDVMFRDRAALERIYPSLVHHAMLSFGSEQVLRFLKKSSWVGRGEEVQTDRRRREDGVRVKHWVNLNSVKFYDKGSVLRSEVTINEPRDFKVWRARQNDPDGEKGWRIMRRSVADLHRRAEVSKAGTERHLAALASVHVRDPLAKNAATPCRAARRKGRRYRGLQPFGQDAALLAAINRGEFTLNGFRNRDIRGLLFGKISDAQQRRRKAAAVTRKLQLLRAHGLIRRISKTHRYQLTAKGHQIVTALQAALQASTEELTHLAA
jgi:hypothetical protein